MIKNKIKQIFKKIVPIGLGIVVSSSFLATCSPEKKHSLRWGDKKFVKEYTKLSYKKDADNVKLVNEIDYSANSSGTIYQMLVYSFADGNNDGIGDFVGAKEKLSYLKKLGISGIWLSPLHPASSYHGYDVIDYTDVAPELGGMEAFNNFLKVAHQLNIKIYLDMVFNHTSYEHPWFQEAIKNPHSKYKQYYRFESDNKGNFKDLGQLGQDSYRKFVNLKNPISSPERYIGKFWHGMPDLNLDNQDVINELKNVQRFWIKKGVDGFRYDAFIEFFSSGEPQINFTSARIFSELRKSGNLGARQAQRNSKFYQFMFGEWWSDAIAASPYYTYKGKKALDAVYDKAWRKRGWDQSLDFKQYQSTVTFLNRIKDSYGNSFVRWMPILDNHDVDRYVTDYLKNIKNMQIFALKKPIEVKGDDISYMQTSMALLLTMPGVPIIYSGGELGYVGNKYLGDATLREPLKWKDAKYIANFTEKRSGPKDTHIRLMFSKNRPTAEYQLSHSAQPAYAISKVNQWRANNDFISLTNENTFEEAKKYITWNKPPLDANAFIRKNFSDTKKFLIVFSMGIKKDLKINKTIKNVVYKTKNVTINQNHIVVGEYGFTIIEV